MTTQHESNARQRRRQQNKRAREVDVNDIDEEHTGRDFEHPVVSHPAVRRATTSVKNLTSKTTNNYGPNQTNVHVAQW